MYWHVAAATNRAGGMLGGSAHRSVPGHVELEGRFVAGGAAFGADWSRIGAAGRAARAWVPPVSPMPALCCRPSNAGGPTEPVRPARGTLGRGTLAREAIAGARQARIARRDISPSTWRSASTYVSISSRSRFASGV